MMNPDFLVQEKVWRKVARVLNRYDIPRLVALAIGARIVASAIAEGTVPEQGIELSKAYAELLTDLLNSYQPGVFTVFAQEIETTLN